jgi:hypothetical protein
MSRRYIYFGSFASATWFSDDYGMPTSAYSVRKLTPNATNCIRVRRSSDNAEQDIGFVSNTPNALIDTTALLSFVGANNGFVVTWYDQSTTGHNFTQSTGSLQPQIVSSGSVVTLNSVPSISMSSAQFWEKTLFTNKLLDIYLVRESTNTISVKFTGQNLSGAGYDFVSQSGSSSTSLHEYYGSPTLYANKNLFTGTTRGQVFTLLNGTKIETQENANIGVSGFNWTYFRFGFYSSVGVGFSGKASELIFFDTSKSSSRNNIVDNQNAIYNVF